MPGEAGIWRRAAQRDVINAQRRGIDHCEEKNREDHGSHGLALTSSLSVWPTIRSHPLGTASRTQRVPSRLQLGVTSTGLKAATPDFWGRCSDRFWSCSIISV